MKREVWLRTNRRAYLLLALLPGLVVFGGALMSLLASTRLGFSFGIGLLVAGCVELLTLVFRASRPRLAYADGQLLVYLLVGRPLQVPIEIVECFFLGQGASMLPHSLEGKHGEAAETSTVVVRLAEAAQEWSHRDVRASLGQWCEGYITIRGTWCEPLSGDVVAGLNRRLVAAHRAQKQSAQKPSANEVVQA